MRGFLTVGIATLAALLLPAGAQAAKSCTEPGPGDWERATPAEAGMDAAALQAAIDYATSEEAEAVRVYRYGCLVGEDRLAPVNRNLTFESWSLGKSVSSILFGAAMTNKEISEHDPVGSLLPEADAAHGDATMEDVLEMTTGVHWNGLRDYNIFTQTDRVGDWLTLPMDREPGTFYEYAQSAVAIVPKAVERATGTDPRSYLQSEILDPLGIEASSWDWERDQQGNIEGFWGARMTPDDFGRLGELLRLRGRWRGEALLSRKYVKRATTPSANNGCYGWLIWVNSAKPCIAPRITDRTVADEYGYPGTPRDGFVFSGLFGQIVAVFPSQGIVIVRTGQDDMVSLAGSSGWQLELFRRVLGSITDEPVDLPNDGPGAPLDKSDEGFQTAIAEPEQYSKGAVPDPLPAAGPARARALIISRTRKKISGRRVGFLAECPQAIEGAVAGCAGKLKGRGAGSVDYDLAAGERQKLRLPLERRKRNRLRRKGKILMQVSSVNEDQADGAEVVERFRFDRR